MNTKNIKNNVRLKKPLRVAQYICSSGFFGAEKWIIALADNTPIDLIEHELLITPETNQSELELAKQFKSIGLPVKHIEMKSRFDRSVISNVVSYIKENKIDVIHTHGYKSDIIGVIAAKKSGIKCVCTPHGFENSKDIKLKIFIATGCQSFRFFDQVVPLSDDLRNVVASYGVKDENMTLIYNGVNLRMYALNARKRRCFSLRVASRPIQLVL